MTEITKMTDERKKNADSDSFGVLYFDGTCSFCCYWTNRVRSPLASIGVGLEAFARGKEETEMKLCCHDGSEYGGTEAALFLAKRFPATRPAAWIISCPPFLCLARRIYRRIAKNRHCSGESGCPLPPHSGSRWGSGSIFTGVLFAGAVLSGFVLNLTTWVWMWMIALAMWLVFKVTIYERAGGIFKIDPRFFLWVGMDSGAFAYENESTTEANAFDLKAPLIFAATGFLLLFVAIPLLGSETALARGWIGVVAMLCILHFGAFALWAALLGRIGFPVRPIMNAPWASPSLGGFWGDRWNRAFSDWARVFLFRPLLRKLGATAGVFAAFLVSGLAHELVVSLPAGGAYGRPTLYFALQGAGVLAEKRLRWLRRNRLLGTAWVWIMVLLPAPLLFHAPFMENVFNPMTKTLLDRWIP